VFLDQLWLKAAFTITGCVELEFAVFGFQRFCRMAVATIGGGGFLVFFITEVGIQLNTPRDREGSAEPLYVVDERLSDDQ